MTLRGDFLFSPTLSSGRKQLLLMALIVQVKSIKSIVIIPWELFLSNFSLQKQGEIEVYLPLLGPSQRFWDPLEKTSSQVVSGDSKHTWCCIGTIKLLSNGRHVAQKDVSGRSFVVQSCPTLLPLCPWIFLNTHSNWNVILARTIHFLRKQ